VAVDDEATLDEGLDEGTIEETKDDGVAEEGAPVEGVCDGAAVDDEACDEAEELLLEGEAEEATFPAE
jgi:hypothetical protein